MDPSVDPKAIRRFEDALRTPSGEPDDDGLAAKVDLDDLDDLEDLQGPEGPERPEEFDYVPEGPEGPEEFDDDFAEYQGGARPLQAVPVLAVLAAVTIGAAFVPR